MLATKNKLLISFLPMFLIQSESASASDVLGTFDLKETPLGRYQTLGVQPMRGGSQDAKLPTSALLKGITPAKDQDVLGTCTSFAVSSCAEYYHQQIFSEAEFTILAETQLPDEDCVPGLCLADALHLARRMGFTEQNRLPYPSYLKKVAKFNGIKTNLDNWKDRLKALRQEEIQICDKDYNSTMAKMGLNFRLSGNASEDITSYRIGGLHTIHHVSRNDLSKALSSLGDGSFSVEQGKGSIGKAAGADINQVKVALSQGYPVAGALAVFSGCWESSLVNKDNPYIQLPKQTHKYRGSHAIVLTGFDDVQESFLLKNSWSQDWGKEGSAWIPYEYVKLYSTELTSITK